jgi:hypothetical protein
MKIRYLNRVVLISVMVFMLVACTPSQSTAPASDTVQPCLAQTGGAPAVDAEALIRDKLVDHHDIGRIFNARHTREEWNVTLDRMIGYGAKINDSEKQIIIDYLLCLQQ